MEKVGRVPVIKIDELNVNHRVYTKEAVDGMIKQFKERINNGIPMYGELGYPENMNVSFSRVSHHVKDLYVEGNVLYADVEFIKDNSNGRTALKMIEDGAGVLRPRAMGTVNEDRTVNIDQLISFDIISADDDAFKGQL
jgi:hypothetical protein